MPNIPEELKTVFTARVTQNGRFTVDIPVREVEMGNIKPGEKYRVAIIEADHSTPELSKSSSEDSVSQSEAQTGSAPPNENFPDPPVDVGDTRQVTIESLGDDGDGIARVENGYVVIVPDTEPGDKPTIEIEETKQNVAFATVKHGYRPSLDNSTDD